MKRTIQLGSLAMLALALVLGLATRGMSEDKKPAGVTVSGKVLGVDGKAAANATVRLFADETPKGKKGKGVAADKGGANGAQKPVALQEVTADADGAFKFSDVAPGSYRIMAGVKKLGKGKASVTVTQGQNVENLEIKLEAITKKKGN